jgi:CMP-N,N'-diacetyllegionaminic acid synthase
MFPSKYLALVLARKGSKRLKNKNILKLGGNSLTSITLKKLQKVSHLFSDILVSSDCPRIKKITKDHNLLFLQRPKKLSGDKISSEKSALHALNYYIKNYKKIDYIALFQVTSPLRKNSTIYKAIKLSKKCPDKQIVAVNKKTLKPNGVIYITPNCFLTKKYSFSEKKFVPLKIQSKKESLDIDTVKDFRLAKKYFKN